LSLEKGNSFGFGSKKLKKAKKKLKKAQNGLKKLKKALKF
jgi:predicted translin family RNA/ssDNA-binding protein